MNDESVQELASKEGVDQPFSAESLKKLCLEEGADDVGFVNIDREAISFERNDLLTAYPKTQTIISIIKTMNRENIQSPIRYVANNEFHHMSHHIEEISRRIILKLNQRGIRGVRTSMGFPMDADRWPGKIWYVSHKVMAVQAGIGLMGIHRNVIHPKFGNFILLDSILIDTPVDRYDQPLQENPCFECRLCISACPVGAVREEGLDFTACATHNYREFMGGFQDWVEQVVSSKSVKSYRSKVHDRETVSFWQSLSFGANYKAAYCMAVCPAGEDIIHHYHADKKAYVQEIVKPLREKEEPVYVNKGTRAESIAKRNKYKELRYAHFHMRPRSVAQFLMGIKLVFDPLKGKGVEVTIHFEFTGKEKVSATVTISKGRLEVHDGLIGKANLRAKVDSETWVAFLNGERSLFRAIITRKLRIKGNPIHLMRFQNSLAI